MKGVSYGIHMFDPKQIPSIWHKGNIIGIDCGFAIKDGFCEPQIGMIKGRLGCIRLDDMKEFYSYDTGTNHRKRSKVTHSTH